MTDLDKMACEILDSRPDAAFGTAADFTGHAYVVLESEARCAIRTALLTAPPGYVLVPVEPTPLMIATFRADNEHGALSWMTHTTLRCADFRSRYAGMLAAAPEVK